MFLLTLSVPSLFLCIDCTYFNFISNDVWNLFLFRSTKPFILFHIMIMISSFSTDTLKCCKLTFKRNDYEKFSLYVKICGCLPNHEPQSTYDPHENWNFTLIKILCNKNLGGLQDIRSLDHIYVLLYIYYVYLFCYANNWHIVG